MVDDTSSNQPESQLSFNLRKAREFAQWLRSKGHGLSVPQTTRHVAAGTTFSLTLDHFEGVVRLLEAGLSGPALALIRPLLESYVQGLWLYQVATDQQIHAFLRSQMRPKLERMLQGIDEKKIFESLIRKDMEDPVLAMHGFTHGGPRHIENRFVGNQIKAAYSEQLLSDALRHAALFGFMALLDMIAMAGNQDLGDAVYSEGRERLWALARRT